MKLNKLFFVGLTFLFAQTMVAQRTEANFNKQWKFVLDQDKEAFSETNFDDANWTELDIPHDWSFEKGVRKGGDQNQGGGYHDGGIGWYRKTFQVNKESLSNITYINFEGVYMNSEVWLNGEYLGKRPYGYISFRYNISKFLKEGENTLAVRVDNSLEPSARWYHPCGIYAPVQLIEVNPLHISPNGIFVTTPAITKTKGSVNVEVKLSAINDVTKNTLLKARILSPEGKVIGTAEQSVVDALKPFNLKMEVNSPQLWSPETPNLYVLETQVIVGKSVVDEVKTNFGFRTIDWQQATGFWLNGENIKLKGVCEHYEGGPVGGAWTKPMLRWKLQKLKDMGINAIRPSHNACPPMFYDICDEIGLLVMDELFDGWIKKAPQDYGKQAFDEWWKRDMEEWITRDRNHPSVFVWSMGNETHGPIAPQLVEHCRNLDPTRKVTSGSSNTHDMEIAGINGGSETKSFIETRKFDVPFISTEAPHTWQTRGYYRTQTWWRDGVRKGTYELPNVSDKEVFFYEWADPKVWKNKKQHFNSSYDNATVRISARKNWEVMRDNAWHSGHFRWTGFDYYGEAGLAHGGLPFNLFMGGAIDVAGFEKDLFYFYQSQWTKEPMVHILPHWTHPRMEKGTLVPVWVYSNTHEVELFLNGKSLGKDKPGLKAEEMQCEWMVPYQEGTLEAVAYIDGKEVKRTSISTAIQPSALQNTVEILEAEAGFNASYLLTSEAVDAKKNLYPYGENKVYYALNGDIEKVSLENGSPVDATSRFKANHRPMFFGKTRAVLQALENAENADVVVASILGDKALYLSKQISIIAEKVQLFGNASKGNLSILYTTNGDNPAINGKVYTTPFEVEDGTTVKAIVKQDDKVLFSMEEKFGADQGLFWGDEHSEDVWIGRGIFVPAEGAQLDGGARATVEGKWFKSDGIVVFDNKEGAITWYQENDGEPGKYKIRIRYAHNDTESKRPMTLTVNGELVKTIEFPATGNWGEGWRFVHAEITFQRGANNIELKSTGHSGPDVDELFID